MYPVRGLLIKNPEIIQNLSKIILKHSAEKLFQNNCVKFNLSLVLIVVQIHRPYWKICWCASQRCFGNKISIFYP